MHSQSSERASPAGVRKSAASNEKMLLNATDPDTTEFDYIVVGSGAGGGTLAARLALGGKRVLVIEAGCDPANASPSCGNALDDVPPAPDAEREVYQVPGYNAAATEDDAMSWQFSVRHYENTTLQAADSKYNPAKDPSTARQAGKGGIFYPRSSGLGGCTGHHAMIIAKPNDEDWNRIFTLTGDESWRAQKMQGYFTRLEDCLYYKVYQNFFQALLLIYQWLRGLVSFINPRSQLDRGGHGYRGWQKTSFIDPKLVWTIARGDRTFRRILIDVIRYLLSQKGQIRALLRAFVSLRLVQFLDPNFGRGRPELNSRLCFIPIGTDGRRRTGLREYLMNVATAHPEFLVLLTGVLAKRVIFKAAADGGAPRAIGIDVWEKPYLYEASPRSKTTGGTATARRYFAKQEIILSCGAFNTPQLLMLSGVGQRAHLDAMGVNGLAGPDGVPLDRIVDLPGVGKNLQDRYEVSVVSAARQDFSTLNGISFTPNDPADPARRQWLKSGNGLYATNGGALAFFRRSTTAESDDPDLFIFGVPAAFRGYYWGWSKQLLRKIKDATVDSRNLWTWVLLKAYTRNNAGLVRLRSDSPLEQPEITFHSFSEGPAAYRQDLTALAEGVEFVRTMNSHLAALSSEIQPGSGRPNGSAALEDWIQHEAWGHHACGTCRIGSDPWQADVAHLKDQDAVLDSKFRVHGVRGLRVVDASVFPTIPGYFIVTPIFMVGEKAADDILADPETYPNRLEAFEAAAIEERRRIASEGRKMAPAASTPTTRIPADSVGLALSGGGVRSATICLGVLQALAKKNLLARIDFLSTVSGGGYIGAFLGRLYTRMQPTVADPVNRVTDVLANNASDEIWWLRSHGQYLTGEGLPDLKEDLGTVWRNVLAVHFSIGTLAVFVFALLHVISQASDAPSSAVEVPWSFLFVPKSGWSPWWWLPIVIALLAVAPASVAYFLAPKPGSAAPYPLFALLTWIALLAAAVAAIGMTDWLLLPTLAIGVLLLAWMWQEAVQWNLPEGSDFSDRGIVARNRLTRGVGTSIALVIGAAFWVIIDTLALRVASQHMAFHVLGGMMGFSLSVPFLRFIMMKMPAAQPNGTFAYRLPLTVTLGIVASLLFGILIVGLDAIAHASFIPSPMCGLWVLCFSLLTSLVIGRAVGFVNLSSLQNLYSGRLARTYLGASSSQRVQPPDKEAPREINAADPEDDLFLHEYHPEANGGPLHLINVCVNENVDALSGRRQTEDNGLAMCVGPEGVSVGVRFHAVWDARSTAPAGVGDKMARMFQLPGNYKANEMTALRALPIGANPDSFHVLASVDTATVAAEPLRLSQWTGISGAAFSTGEGRLTSLPVALLFGILNLRLGYWWNSGVDEGDRPDRYPPSFLRRLKSLPGDLFRTQRTILNEWRAYFGGPSKRLWYLSDGGHFENTGLYELIRRRVPFMIAVDAEGDPTYHFDAMGLVVRQTRLDFGAHFSWIDPSDARQGGATGWDAIDSTTRPSVIPAWIRAWLNPDSLGPLTGISRSGKYAASVAEIRYADDSAAISWLVVLKASLAIRAMQLDLHCYSVAHATFPNQSTVDQFPTDEEWESCRLVGESIGRETFA